MSWKRRAELWPRYTPAFEFNRDKIALLVVDVQYIFCDPKRGAGPTLRASHPELANYYYARVQDTVIPNIAKLVTSFRDSGLRRVWLRCAGNDIAASDCTFLMQRTDRQVGLEASDFSLQSPATQIVDQVRPTFSEITLIKPGFGAMTASTLDFTLRNMGIDQLLVAGVWTDCCVEQTATVAAELGYRTTIVEDATATLDQDSHDSTLARFWRLFGNVTSTDEALERIIIAKVTEIA